MRISWLFPKAFAPYQISFANLSKLRQDAAMGIQSGSVTLSRYRVLGSAKGLGLKSLNERLAPYIAGDVDLKGLAGETVLGWVRPVGIDRLDLAPSAHWDMADARLENGFLLRMRIEKRKVPSSLLQLVLRQKLAEAQEKSDKPLGRKDKAALKDKTQRDLMARSLPTIGHVDAYWKVDQGDLILFAASKTVRTQFEQLFQSTFGVPFDLSLLAVEPPTLGLGRNTLNDSDVAEDVLSRLSLAVPVAFADHAYP